MRGSLIVEYLRSAGPTLGKDLVFMLGISWADLDRAEAEGRIVRADPPEGVRGWLYQLPDG